MSLYYRIWVDAIVAQKEKKSSAAGWKLSTIVQMSALQGVNLFTFLLWMKVLINHNLLLFFPVNIFNERSLNGFISVLITLFIPFVILNYLLIFTNNRYEMLIMKYDNQGGKLFKKYALISLGILFVPLIIDKLFL